MSAVQRVVLRILFDVPTRIPAAKARLVRDTFRDPNLLIGAMSGHPNTIRPDR